MLKINIKTIIILLCFAVAALFLDGCSQPTPKPQNETTSHIVEPISGTDGPKKEVASDEYGDRSDDPIPSDAAKNNDGKIIFADSVTLPETDTLNIFAFEQTEGAAQLKEKVETLFGIDSLDSTENSVDQFFDSRGVDKKGSQITFQQNTVSGSFTYSVTFSDENNQKFLDDYSGINLKAMLPRLTEVAKNFAAEFKSVTGELVFKKAEQIECGFMINEDMYTYEAYSFCFVRKTPITVTATDSIEAQGTADDMFYIDLRPDGEVISIISYATNAPMQLFDKQEMCTTDQLYNYLVEQEALTAEDMGHHNPTCTVVSCNIVYVNDYCVGLYKPYISIKFHFADNPDIHNESIIPVSFITDCEKNVCQS